MYEYKAVVTRVVDGDTIKLKIDLGFSIFHDVTVRMLDYDAPEMRGAESPLGKISKQKLIDLIENKTVIVKTEKDKSDKYGRYLARVYIPDAALGDININYEMLLFVTDLLKESNASEEK